MRSDDQLFFCPSGVIPSTMLYVRPMNIRPFARRALTSFPIVLLAVLALGGGVAAATPNTIEGVWSFNGGAVGIQALSNGTFQGTVVAPTKFAECAHPVGEVMWTDMRPQADGSFWGYHQWYRGSQCEVVPQLGRTAWRVRENAQGARFLQVCFSNPSNTSQPTIAADGTSAGVTYGCANSALIAALPTSPVSASKYVILPSNRLCLSRRSFQIHLHNPKNDPLKKVVITLRGHSTVIVRRGHTLVSTINLRGLPRGTFTVKIRVTTILGHHLSSSRTYHTCKPKPKRRRGSKHPAGVRATPHHHR
jgi:hypothetical protein